MIVVNTRNRHNLFPKLVGLLAAPATGTKDRQYIYATAPVCVVVQRPDEVVQTWGPLTEAPGRTMHDALTQIGRMRKNGRLGELARGLGEPELGYANVDLYGGAQAQFTRAHFGERKLFASVAMSTSTTAMTTVEKYDVVAAMGLLQTLLSEHIGALLGTLTIHVLGLWDHTARLKELVQVLNYPAHLTPKSPYALQARPAPLLADSDLKTFAEDCGLMLDDNCTIGLRTPWLRRTAQPVMASHQHLLAEPAQQVEALEIAQQTEAPDWNMAARAWCEGASTKT